ncbi:unnamed protein product, partial [marine sediment metagenome]
EAFITDNIQLELPITIEFYFNNKISGPPSP